MQNWIVGIPLRGCFCLDDVDPCERSQFLTLLQEYTQISVATYMQPNAPSSVGLEKPNDSITERTITHSSVKTLQTRDTISIPLLGMFRLCIIQTCSIQMVFYWDEHSYICNEIQWHRMWCMTGHMQWIWILFTVICQKCAYKGYVSPSPSFSNLWIIQCVSGDVFLTDASGSSWKKNPFDISHKPASNSTFQLTMKRLTYQVMV